jgi:predicted GNAT superfamily acetyltransferase
MGTQTLKYEVRESSLDELSPLIPLMTDHWEESAKNKELMVLSPDYERYSELEYQGGLVCLAAVAGGTIVGYSVNFLQPHLHYSELMCGYNDLIYVSPEYRASPLGIRLIKKTREALKQKGARLMLWHAKENTTLDKLLPRMGCKVQETIYSEEL